MFKRIKLRIQDMRTISKLISGAGEEARASGEKAPGAEHFLLSALNLPDGSAERVFYQMGIDADTFRDGVAQQYDEAFNQINIDDGTLVSEIEQVEVKWMFQSSKPSGEAVMEQLHTLRKSDTSKPLMGAHVVAVVASMNHGVAARAFRSIGIDSGSLVQAVNDELASL